MKRILTVVFMAGVALLAGALSACTSAPTLTFAQQVTITCSAVQTEIAALKTAGVFTGGAANTLNTQVQPDVAAVCAAGATVTAANLQNLVNATLPVMITVIGNSSLTADAKNQAVTAVTLLGITVNTAIAMAQAQATHTAVTLHM